jgi:YVTN family beta-propeller protein
MRKVMVGAHLWGVGFDESSSKLYLAHTGTADVVSLDERTQAVSTIPVGQIPCAVALDEANHKLYAVNYADETVSVIETANGKVLATLRVGRHPQAVAVDPKRNRIYVANVHGNSVTVIDGAKNRVIGSYEAGEHPYALAVDSVTGKVYAANYGTSASTLVDVPPVTHTE